MDLKNHSLDNFKIYQEEKTTNNVFLYDNLVDENIFVHLGIAYEKRILSCVKCNLFKKNRIYFLKELKKSDAQRLHYTLGYMYTLKNKEDISKLDSWFISSQSKIGKSLYTDFLERKIVKCFPLTYRNKFDIMNGTWSTSRPVDSYCWFIKNRDIATKKKFLNSITDGVSPYCKKEIKKIRGGSN